MIGISSTTPQYLHALSIARELKSDSSIPIIFGGVHPTVMPKEVLQEDCVDYVVVGEAEETFNELLESIASGKDPSTVKGIGYKGRKLRFTEPHCLIKDLDSLAFLARHLLPSRWYFAPQRIRGVWTNSLRP